MTILKPPRQTTLAARAQLSEPLAACRTPRVRWRRGDPEPLDRGRAFALITYALCVVVLALVLAPALVSRWGELREPAQRIYRRARASLGPVAP